MSTAIGLSRLVHWDKWDSLRADDDDALFLASHANLPKSATSGSVTSSFLVGRG